MSDDDLRRALERMREFAQHDTSCIFSADLSGINGDEWAGDNARRCNCGFDDALGLYDAALAARPEPRPEAINDHERTCPDCQRVIADEQREHDARPEPRAEGLRALHDHEWDCRSDGHTVEFEGCPECKHVAETLAATPPAPMGSSSVPDADPAPLDVRDPRFVAAVDAVFAAPGEFGPAKGYYGSDTGHFIDMLEVALAPEQPERCNPPTTHRYDRVGPDLLRCRRCGNERNG